MVKKDNVSDSFIRDDSRNKSLNYGYFILIVFLFSIGFVIGFNYISYDNVTKTVNYQLQAMHEKIQSWSDDEEHPYNE